MGVVAPTPKADNECTECPWATGKEDYGNEVRLSVVRRYKLAIKYAIEDMLPSLSLPRA